MRQGSDKEAIVHDLVRVYEVDPATARHDVEAFAAAAAEAGLLGPCSAVDGCRGGARLLPPRREPALDAVYRTGEAAVRVVCHPPDVAASFAHLAAPAAAPGGTTAEVCLTLYRDRGEFVLTRDGRLVDRLTTAPAARWAMVRQLVVGGRRRPWLALLHAGAVATPASALLLCGDSGAGKSTLLAGLVHAGLAFLADDILPLEAGTHRVWPVPLAISVKQGSWPAVGALFPELTAAPPIRFGGRTMRYLWPGAAAAAGTAGFPAAMLLFPRYVEGAPVALQPLDATRSLVLLGEGGSVLPSTDAGLAEFLAWLAGTPAYELAYGRLDGAVRLACTLAEGQGAGHGGAAPQVLVAAAGDRRQTGSP